MGLALLTVGGLWAGSILQDQPAPPQQPAVGSATALPPVDLVGDPLPPGAVVRLGTVRFRHGGGWAHPGVVFLGDHKTILSGGENGLLHFWEATTGRRLRTIPTRLHSLNGFDLSPDEKLLAVVGQLPEKHAQGRPGTIRLLSLASGTEVRSIPLADRGMERCSLVFTPDGKRLISMGARGVLRIHQVATGALIQERVFPPDNAPVMALSPDGQTLAIASGYDFYLWDWQTGQEPRKVALPLRPDTAQLSPTIHALCYSADGKELAIAAPSGRSVEILEVPGLRFRQLPQVQPQWSNATSLAFSVDRQLLAVGTAGWHGDKQVQGSVLLYELAFGLPRWRFRTPAEAVQAIAVSGDNQWVTASTESCLHVWNLTTGAELAANPAAHHGVAYGLAATKEVIATASVDGTVQLWDANTGQQRFRLNHDQKVASVALSGTGRLVASSSLDDTVRLWDARTGREIHRLLGHGHDLYPRRLTFTPDEECLLSWGSDFSMRTWDTRSGRLLRERDLDPDRGQQRPDFEHQQQELRRTHARRISTFSADGRYFFLNNGHLIELFEVESGRKVRSISTEITYLHTLTCSPDQQYVLVNGLVSTRGAEGSAEEHLLGLYEVATGKQVRLLRLPGRQQAPLAFSPDGRRYAEASGSPEGRIRIWDTATGAELPGLGPITGRMLALAFLPDGRRLVTTMNDTTALIWALPEAR